MNRFLSYRLSENQRNILSVYKLTRKVVFFLWLILGNSNIFCVGTESCSYGFLATPVQYTYTCTQWYMDDGKSYLLEKSNTTYQSVLSEEKSVRYYPGIPQLMHVLLA